mmetsp:Transcript_16913/g.26393  ORF Transcript_16913/g.26393 Transcript_16913/m.26393 type:complete len:86 (+) Transcript_16913:1246-1503(+)
MRAGEIIGISSSAFHSWLSIVGVGVKVIRLQSCYSRTAAPAPACSCITDGDGDDDRLRLLFNYVDYSMDVANDDDSCSFRISKFV